MLAALTLTLVTAVGVQLDDSTGLDPADSRALVGELAKAVEVVTGAPAEDEASVMLVVRARRVGWRIRVGVERKEGGSVLGRFDVDLTRNRGSWPGPLLDVAKTLLPEGRSLATRRTLP